MTTKDNKVPTSTRLRQALEMRGMSQADLIRQAQPYCEERKLKLTKSDVSQFLSGKVIPSQWKISIMAHALHVNEAWLWGFDAPIDPPAPGAAEAGEDDQDDVMEIREALRRDPNMRILFSAAAKVSPEHIKTAAALLKALEPEEFSE